MLHRYSFQKIGSKRNTVIVRSGNENKSMDNVDLNDLISIHKAYMREMTNLTNTIRKENCRKFDECSEILKETKKENLAKVYETIKDIHYTQYNSIQKIKDTLSKDDAGDGAGEGMEDGMGEGMVDGTGEGREVGGKVGDYNPDNYVDI